MNTTTTKKLLEVMDDAASKIESEWWPEVAQPMRAACITVRQMLSREQRVRIVLAEWEEALAEFHGTTAAKAMMAICAKELRAALDT